MVVQVSPGEVNIRIDSESSWTTSHDCVRDVAGAAGRTRNREPVACYVNRFAEGHADVRICRSIGRAVCRCGGRDGRRDVNCSETEDKVRHHIVRRITTVLIGDLCRIDRDGANLTIRKVRVWIDRKGRWTTCYNLSRRRCELRCWGTQSKPFACYVYRFAESNVTSELIATPVAPLVGVVAVTDGA